MIGVASDFEIDALAARALTGHGRNDLLSTGFPAISTLVVGLSFSLPIKSRLRTAAVMSIDPNPR